jgi:hypothetical protein
LEFIIPLQFIETNPDILFRKKKLGLDFKVIFRVNLKQIE